MRGLLNFINSVIPLKGTFITIVFFTFYNTFIHNWNLFMQCCITLHFYKSILTHFNPVLRSIEQPVICFSTQNLVFRKHMF